MLHRKITYSDNHVIHAMEAADQTEREALPVTIDDVGKICWQKDEDSFWFLTNNSPATWVQFALPSSGILTGITLRDYTNNIHADATHHRIKNVEGTTLTKGMAVMFSGYNSGEDAVEVVAGDNSVAPSIGIVEEDILNGEFGMCIASGIFEGIDTSGYTGGEILFVDGNGDLTNTEPITGYAQPIAMVIRVHATLGAYLVLAAYPKQDASDVRYDATSTVADHIGNSDIHMDKTVYDPTSIAGDVFDLSNHYGNLDSGTFN